VTAQEDAHRSLRAGSRSFALAGRLLPRAARDDASVVYAWCRRADDLVDEVPPAEAAGNVARLRAELSAIYAGRPQRDPLLAAFQRVVTRHQIPRAHPEGLLAGMAMDARPAPIVFGSWAELRRYCHCAAGTVGLMMSRVLGVTDDRAAADAAALGAAMQLTNIARDVGEDWARGRLYLPPEAFPAGAPALRPGTPMTDEVAALLAAAVPGLLAAAAPLYDRGDRGIAVLPLRPAIAIRAARLIYAAIGACAATRAFDPRAPRAVVSRWRKWWLVVRAVAGVTTARLVRPRARPAPIPEAPLRP
jgi:15-cis-phytoene synthase